VKEATKMEGKPDRRPRAPSVPADALGLGVVALVVSLLVIAFAWFALIAIRGAISVAAQPAPDNPPMVVLSLPQSWRVSDILLVLVGLVPLGLLVPAARGIALAQQSRVSLAAKNLIETRVLNAASRSSSFFALGYAFAALIVFGLALFVVLNDVAVGKTFFRLDIIFGSFGLVAQAFLTNVFIFCIAEVFILIWGLIVAVARLIPGKAGQPIRFLATAYTDIFRGLPSIITIYLVGFGLPLTGLPLVKDLSPNWAAILALTLTYGAYVAEVYRAGIESIHPSQFSAARSLGLSFGQTMRFVIVPQAVRRIIPPLLNDFIGLQKDTALVNVIGTIDAFNQAKIIASNRFNLSSVATVAFLFVIITIPQARWVDRLLEREQRRTRN
jgi:polar amino acid transport system permease protein